MALKLADSQVFLRDTLVPFKDANLSIASSPVLYGLSVYTVCMATWDDKNQQLNVFRLKDHYRRLCNSAQIMDFHSFAGEWSYERFAETVQQLLRANKVRENALIRATVFIDELSAGTRMNGLRNSLSIFVYPMVPVLNPKGVHLCVSSWQRTPDNAIPARAKVNGSYINASLMKNEALQNGYDDSIAIDEHGHVSESTVSNIFIVKNGVLITPDASTDLLEGITRDTVLVLAAQLGIKTEERAVDRSELYTADEIFLSGSSARLAPALSVDKRTVGKGQPGPIFSKLQKRYQEVQLQAPNDHTDWLTAVKTS